MDQSKNVKPIPQITTDFGGAFDKPAPHNYAPTMGVWNPVTGKIVEARFNGLCPYIPPAIPPANEPK